MHAPEYFLGLFLCCQEYFVTRSLDPETLSRGTQKTLLCQVVHMQLSKFLWIPSLHFHVLHKGDLKTCGADWSLSVCFWVRRKGVSFDSSQLTWSDPSQMQNWIRLKFLFSDPVQDLRGHWNEQVWGFRSKSIFNTTTLCFYSSVCFSNAFICSIWSIPSTFSFYISKASNG